MMAFHKENGCKSELVEGKKIVYVCCFVDCFCVSGTYLGKPCK